MHRGAVAWPTAVAWFGVALGLAAVAALVVWMEHVSVVAVLLALAAWQALGAATAAALILAGTAVAALRGRPLAIADSAAPRRVAIAAGGGLAAAALVGEVYALTLGRWLGGLAIVLVAGVVVAAWAGLRCRRTGRDALVALALAIAVVEVPRELDLVGGRLSYSATTTEHHEEHRSTCTGGGGGSVQLADVTRSWRLVSHLGGNVGSLIAAPEVVGGDGELVVVADGTVDAGWLACWLPLYKPIAIDTTLSFRFEVRDGARARCSGSGTIDLHIDHTTTGFAACRDVRENLAVTVVGQLGGVARRLGGR